ncbi:MAG TPA: GDSL-type esterase/lipase family protein [Candidatus Polarisedimenticolia bacterium]|nr:GDSL-type esterase/lipase family protein [Candidatus Polarisedimenticolia bacterium]
MGETADRAGGRPPATPGVRRWSGLRQLVFIAFIWLAIVVCLEAALRFAGFSPPRAAELAPRYSKFQPDDELIWALKPDWSGFELSGVPLRHNSLGLRGPEPAPRDEAGFRILFVGDSVTYGHDLREDFTVPLRLEFELEARSDTPFEVINAGVPGFSTFQEAILLRRIARALEPDMVLLGFCLNDVTERYTSLAGFGGSRYFMMYVDTAAEMSLPRRLWLESAMREAAVRLVRSSARRGETYRVRSLWEQPEEEHIRAAWETVFAEIAQVADEARRIDAPLAVILYPHARQVETASGADAPQEKLASHLEARGIPFLDLLGPMRASGFRMEQLYLDPTHFSPPGAALVAKAIAGFLLDAGLASPERKTGARGRAE